MLLSPITFGAMRIESSTLSDGLSLPLLHALDHGVNCIDTARAYGPSEQIVAATLRAHRGPRPFLATKVAPLPTGDWRHYVPLEKSFTPASITASLETSLHTLGVDTIDLLQLHQWYYLWTHRPEWLATFQDLKRQGKIRFFGVSAQDHEHDAALQLINANLVDSVQFVFNIFESRPLVSFLPLAKERGVATIARCVLDSGGLTGQITDAQLSASPYFQKAPPSEYRRRLNLLQSDPLLSAIPLPELAIRFALTSDAVTTMTLSMATIAEVNSSLASAAKGPLPAQIFHHLRRNHSWFKNLWA